MSNVIQEKDCMPNAPNECCRVPGNTPVVPDHPDANLKANLQVRVCKVCGCRHFLSILKAGHINLTGGKVG